MFKLKPSKSYYQTNKVALIAIFANLYFLCSSPVVAQNYWLKSASWMKAGAYKECGGIIFNTCWHDMNIYTNMDSARIGDLIIVYSGKTKKEIARFNVKGIQYETDTNRCWITAKAGKKPDTYLTVLGCY